MCLPWIQIILSIVATACPYPVAHSDSVETGNCSLCAMIPRIAVFWACAACTAQAWMVNHIRRAQLVPKVLMQVTCAPAVQAPSDESERAHFFGHGDPTHKPSILQQITEQRYKDADKARLEVSAADLQQHIKEFEAQHGGPLSLYDRIAQTAPSVALAAEFKRASPSKGDIAVHLDAAEQGVMYTSVGAAVLSVLTEPKWFKGSLQDMRDVRLATQKLTGAGRPAVLRKDFVIDEYMVLEGRANGADTVLLIVAILEVSRQVEYHCCRLLSV